MAERKQHLHQSFPIIIPSPSHRLFERASAVAPSHLRRWECAEPRAPSRAAANREKRNLEGEKKKTGKKTVCSQTVSKPPLLLGCQETRLTAETKGPADTEDLLLFSSRHHVSSEEEKKKKECSPPLVYGASEVCLGFKLGVNFLNPHTTPLQRPLEAECRAGFFSPSFPPELLRHLHLLGFSVQPKVSPGGRLLNEQAIAVPIGSDFYFFSPLR